jgi:uncharacterized membrane protein
MASIFIGFAITSIIQTFGFILDRLGFLSLRASILWRSISSVLFGIFFCIAGLGHFDAELTKKLYLPMMPPFIPYQFHTFINTISGLVEIIVGLATLVFVVTGNKYGQEVTAIAALVVLLAVFPANINVALNPHLQKLIGHTQTFANVRLLIQVTFAIWASWPLFPFKNIRSTSGIE